MLARLQTNRKHAYAPISSNYTYMSTLQERMEEFLRETGLSVTQVAKTAGVSASAVSQWKGDGAKEIKSIGKIEAALYLERATGFSALWLAKGIGPKRVAPKPAPLDLGMAIEMVGEAIDQCLSPESRLGAVSMLGTYIASPKGNADLIPLIAKRLSGESGNGRPDGEIPKAA